MRMLAKRYFILLIALAALLSASCSVIPDATQCGMVVDSFMKAAAVRDVDTAYSLFVEGVAREDVEKLVLENSDYFSGYQDISVRGLNIEYVGPDFSEYKGTARYSDGKRIEVGDRMVILGTRDQLRFLDEEK